MLDHELSRPGGAAEGDTVAVLLHGRGSHKGDLQGLRSRLPDDWTVVTPQAPHPGGPWGYGPGWAWYRYLEEDRVEASTLEAGLDALHGFLDDLPDLLGFLPGRLVLGGFSQGGTVSMVYGLDRGADRISTILNFSGFLPGDPALPGDVLSPDKPPVFWGHGRTDPAIPFALAVRGRTRLEEHGVPLRTSDHDIGHWIDPDEVAAAVSFVQSFADAG